MNSRSVIQGLAITAALFTPMVPAWSDQGHLQSLRMGIADGITRMVISVPRETTFTVDESDDGALIRIDLADIAPPKEQLMTRRVGLVERTALSQHSGGLRLALALSEAGRVLAAKPTIDAHGRHGIAIDMVPRAWQPQTTGAQMAFLEYTPEPAPNVTNWNAAIKSAGINQDEAISAWLWSTHTDRQVFALAPAGTQPVPHPRPIETADASN